MSHPVLLVSLPGAFNLMIRVKERVDQGCIIAGMSAFDLYFQLHTLFQAQRKALGV